MSGLVQRLIARSREPVTGIRPRPASLYEDQPPMSRAQAEPPAFSDVPDPAPAARVCSVEKASTSTAARATSCSICRLPITLPQRAL
ncbi:hypothetical protein, partial [Nonomuraea sp. NPDC003201]